MTAHTETGRDQLWIIPSRGRPTRLRAMLRTALRLAAARTDFAICCDDDDETAAGYGHTARLIAREYPGRVAWHTGSRDTLAGWTNRIARNTAYTRRYAALGSMGDDHIPRESRPGTPPWDRALQDALEAGAVYAYGDDLHQHEALATAWLARREAVEALGWLILPAVDHYFGDNAITDLGAVYVPGVRIEHCHPLFGTRPADGTYAEAAGSWEHDRDAYERWQADEGPEGMASCRATLGTACGLVRP